MEYGLRSGLAQTLDWNRRAEMDRYNANLGRQAKIQAEQKAKMFADDFDYNNAMNPHDNPLVKQFAMNKLMEIGSFMRQNPDWQTDPMKRAIYKTKIHELKDNPDLNRGLVSDANFKMMNDYVANPKNSEMANDPEIKKSFKQWENYRNFGNQFAGSSDEVESLGGKREFRFIPPEEGIDTTKMLIDNAKDTEYDDIKSFGYQNSGQKMSISTVRKKLAAQHALASNNGRYLRKDYQNYLEKLTDPIKAKSIEDYTMERMNPYFKSEKIERAYLAPLRINDYTKNGNGKEKELLPNMWLSILSKARKDKRAVEAGPDALDKTFGNSFGQHNLNGVKSPLGDQLNLGLTNANATGLIYSQEGPGGKPYAEYEAKVRMPLKEFVRLGDKYDNVIDEGASDVLPNIGQLLPGPPGGDNWDIHDNYKDQFKKYIDEKGKAFVEFPVRQMFDPDNAHLADTYTNAHNVKQHAEDIYNTGEDNIPTINTKEDYDALSKGTKYKDGNGKVVEKR